MATEDSLITRLEVETTWDVLAAGRFEEAALREVDVHGAPFQVLHLPRDESFKPKLAWRTGLSFVAMPRFAAYRHRVVLLPNDIFLGSGRGRITERDIADLIFWCTHMQHVCTVSTFKSGASHPFMWHAQSFPLLPAGGTMLTALAGARGSVLLNEGQVPHFETLRIERLDEYPVRGLRITGDAKEVMRRIYEVALNYDELKAFNLILLPTAASFEAYLFPRPKHGRAIYPIANRRWQIAALEVNGLIQAKTADDAAQTDARTIQAILGTASLSEEDFETFLLLLDTF